MKDYWLAELLKDMEMRLAPAEQEYADAMLKIVERHGKLSDVDGNGIWVGYLGPDENDTIDIGVKCSNCYFHASNSVCKIVAARIMPDGRCRLAAIPDDLVKKDNNDDQDEEDDNA
jgi:hypothetical protein